MRALVFILTCLAAIGCTRPKEQVSEQQPPPADPPAKERPKPAVDQRPVIAVLGDSLAEGFGVEAGRSFPDLVESKLQSAGYQYRVVNLGVSGDTTTGGLGRIAYALSLKPEVLVLELGGNDGLRGVPVASTRANLEKMIVAAQKEHVDVLLAGMTLPPNYGSDYIRSFEANYTDLARKYKLPLIPFLMEQIAAQLKSRPDLMQRDGIHPTAAGHELIAETVFRYLKPMLNRSSEAHRSARAALP
jgi:acyl-CoA thioesterase-1